MRINSLPLHWRTFLLASVLISSAAGAQVGAPPATQATPPARPREIRHVVKPGDTLWDIARTYLKDPFRWEEVFKRNTDVVKNPHWIYPEEVLVIPASEVRDEVVARADSNGYVVARAETRPAAAPVNSDQPTVFARVTTSTPDASLLPAEREKSLTVRKGEYEAAPYIAAPAGPSGAGRIAGTYDRPAVKIADVNRFQLNDRMYITAPPGVQLAAGTLLGTFALGDEIGGIGRVVVPTGVIEVEATAPGLPARARLIRQFAEVRLEQLVLPLDSSFRPTTARAVQGAYPVTTRVVWLQRQPVLPSLQYFLALDASNSAGIRTGDQFTVYDEPTSARGFAEPPVPTAVAQAIRVTEFGTTAMIVRQLQPKIREGMRARLSARMP